MLDISLYIIAFFVSAFAIVGIHTVTRQGNVLWFCSWLMCDENGEPEFKMANTLSECLVCMSSFWGLLFFTAFFPPDENISIYFGLYMVLIIISSQFERTFKGTLPGGLDKRKVLEGVNQTAFLFALAIEGYKMYKDFSIYLLAFILSLCGFLFLIEQIVQYCEEIRNKNKQDAKNDINKAKALNLIIKTIKETLRNGE